MTRSALAEFWFWAQVLLAIWIFSPQMGFLVWLVNIGYREVHNAHHYNRNA